MTDSDRRGGPGRECVRVGGDDCGGGCRDRAAGPLHGAARTPCGTLESVFITYAGGGLLVALAMLMQRGGNLAAAAGAPWYAYTAGALGLIIVGTLAYSAPRLGLVAAFTVFVAAQFAMGAMVDHFGWLGSAVRPLTLPKWIGMAVVLAGVWLIVRD